MWRQISISSPTYLRDLLASSSPCVQLCAPCPCHIQSTRMTNTYVPGKLMLAKSLSIGFFTRVISESKLAFLCYQSSFLIYLKKRSRLPIHLLLTYPKQGYFLSSRVQGPRRRRHAAKPPKPPKPQQQSKQLPDRTLKPL